jgi:hypothetical protein
MPRARELGYVSGSTLTVLLPKEATPIECSIQINPSIGHANIRFILSPGAVRGTKMTPYSLVQKRRIAQLCVSYGRLIARRPILSSFLHVTVIKRMCRPADTQHGPRVLKVPALNTVAGV